MILNPLYQSIKQVAYMKVFQISAWHARNNTIGTFLFKIMNVSNFGAATYPNAA